jgi:hypothetical protein
MEIPKANQKRLIRLISAATDMGFVSSAFGRFIGSSDEDERHHLLVSMVLAYSRPFTKNLGIGSLRSEYPTFPDFSDDEMNQRHRKIIDIRNKFLAHSSIEGTKVWILTPGAVSPASGEKAVGYGYTVAKLTFTEPSYVRWLYEVVPALSQRLNADIKALSEQVYSKLIAQAILLDTGANPFRWTR